MENLDKFDPELLDDEEEYEALPDAARLAAEEAMQARDQAEGRGTARPALASDESDSEPEPELQGTDSGKKQTSLFSFFKKAAKPKCTEEGAPSSLDVSSLKAEAEAQAQDRLVSRGRAAWQAGALAWAKLPGYPWWPAMVCPHPRSEEVVRKVEGQQEVHLMFLGEGLRSWAGLVRPWGQEVDQAGGRGDALWRRGLQEAEEAAELTDEERLALLLPATGGGESQDGDDESSDAEEPSPAPMARRAPTAAPPRKRRRIVVCESESESDSEEERAFEVERVLDMRVEEGTTQFLIKWKGFNGAEDNTWEPRENLNCEEMIEKFLGDQEGRAAGGLAGPGGDMAAGAC